MTTPLALIAFDLDGTLVDSLADLHAAVVAMERALGREASSLEAVRGRIGNGVERLVHRTLTGTTDGEAEPATLAAALQRFGSAYDALNGTRATLYPHVAAELGRLDASGVPLAVVTNKARRFTVPLLERLGIAGRFAHVLAGDELPTMKPDPAPLLELARRAATSPARCALVGDSISDMRAARAAGFAAIGVSYGYNHGRPIRELDGDARPDLVIDSFAELPDALARVYPRSRRARIDSITVR